MVNRLMIIGLMFAVLQSTFGHIYEFKGCKSVEDDKNI